MNVRLIAVWLAVALAGGCGDDQPAAQTSDASSDARSRQDIYQQTDGDIAEDPAPADAGDDSTSTDATDTPQQADTGDPDADDVSTSTDEGRDDPGVRDTATDESPDLPPATDDCDPLGIPERWAGTFEGDITSNVNDIAGYRFGGPVSGDMTFEIRCVNEKLVVFGNLNGSADECALVNGCPFTAQLNGFYYPDTRQMEGQILNGTIDFILVQVYAEGEFEGTVSEEPSITGVWSGEKTDIAPATFAWVEASGEGTWEADPVIP